MRGRASTETRGRWAALLALLALSLCSVGCASPRQAAGVGLIIVGTVAAAAGAAATDIFEDPDPSQPVSARTCLDQCTRGSDSGVDALLVAGGAAAVLAGEALANTAPTKAPAASSPPSSPAAPAPVAPSPTRCLGPLREPALAGCAP